MKGWVDKMPMDYETTAFAIRLNLDKVLYSLQTMNSYITSRDNYKVLLEEGVLDPTCYTDLKTNISSLVNYLTQQTKELNTQQEQNHMLICRLILAMHDSELEAIVNRCDSIHVRFTTQELINKAANRTFTAHEYAILSLVISNQG